MKKGDSSHLIPCIPPPPKKKEEKEGHLIFFKLFIKLKYDKNRNYIKCIAYSPGIRYMHGIKLIYAHYFLRGCSAHLSGTTAWS